MQDLDLCDFTNIVFFTGAGISAESGIPTYRGPGGIWKSYDYENCASQEAFDSNPEYVWEFHNYRRKLVSACKPNVGHQIIAATEQQISNTSVVTQNIDGLHQKAGSQTVHELHGSLWKIRCDSCGYKEEDLSAQIDNLHCPQCNAYKRPDIVWFGDMLKQDVIQNVHKCLQKCNLLISIGTSAVVYPAAQLPIVAKTNGAILVEINPEPTPLSEIYDINLRMTASEALQLLGRNLR